MNIYAGNLNYNLSEEELEKVFGEYGEVTSVKIIRDKYTDQSKGFGFIEMADDAAAQKATGAVNLLPTTNPKCDKFWDPLTVLRNKEGWVFTSGWYDLSWHAPIFSQNCYQYLVHKSCFWPYKTEKPG